MSASAEHSQAARFDWWAVARRTGKGVISDRATGLAAEMAFFALLSFVPLLVAFGAALGYLERIVGTGEVRQIEGVVLDTLSFVLSPEATQEVFGPLVRALLYEQRGGFAITSLAATLWLASRVFTATIRALDLAFDEEERRNPFVTRGLAVLFALGAVVVTVTTLGLMVVGPLFGGGHAIAAWLGLGEAFAFVWSIGRWPLVVAVLVGFLVVLYQYGPYGRRPWRACLAGAAVGVTGWILASLGFRAYLAAGLGMDTDLTQEAAAAAALAVFGAIVVSVLWVYVSSIVILVGGEFAAQVTQELGAQDG